MVRIRTTDEKVRQSRQSHESVWHSSDVCGVSRWRWDKGSQTPSFAFDLRSAQFPGSPGRFPCLTRQTIMGLHFLNILAKTVTRPVCHAIDLELWQGIHVTAATATLILPEVHKGTCQLAVMISCRYLRVIDIIRCLRSIAHVIRQQILMI
jgi:hypothetical protein